MGDIVLRLDHIGGGDPREIIRKAVDVAAKIGCWVRIDVNTVEVLIAPDHNKETVIDAWSKAIDRKAAFCSANVIPNPV